MSGRRIRQILLLSALPAGGVLVASLLSGTVAMAVGAALVVFAVSYVMMSIYDRIARVDEEVRTGLRQIEELIQIHRIIDVRAPLPSGRGWAISPDFASAILDALVTLQPRLVVEIGSGLSTIITAYWLQAHAGGRLVSIEHDPGFAELTRARLRTHGLEDRVEIRIAPLLPQAFPDGTRKWYDQSRIEDLTGVDLLVVDGPPRPTGEAARSPVRPVFENRMAPRCRVLFDDGQYLHVAKTAEEWAASDPAWHLTRLETEKIAYQLDRAPGDA